MKFEEAPRTPLNGIEPRNEIKPLIVHLPEISEKPKDFLRGAPGSGYDIE